MRRVSSSSLIRSLAVPAVALALLVSGCGSSDDKAPAKSDALSVEKAQSALLTQEEVGEKFKLDTSPDDDSEGPGCLADLDKANTDAPTEEKRSYAATDNELGSPLVDSQIASYANEDDAKQSFVNATKAVEGCTSVDAADKDGAVFKLTLTHNADKSFADAAEQLNITAKGSVTVSGQEVPVVLTFSAVRIKNSVTVLTVTDLADEPTPGISNLLDTVAKRLVAVVDGKDPDAA